MSLDAPCPRCADRPWLRNELCPACEAVIAATSEPIPYRYCQRHDQEFPVGDTCARCKVEAHMAEARSALRERIDRATIIATVDGWGAEVVLRKDIIAALDDIFGQIDLPTR